MAHAENLKARLEKELGNNTDVLSSYRRFLDESNIPAELEGWPTEEAYDEKNIKEFISIMQS